MIHLFETVVPAERGGERLDRFLSTHLPELPPRSVRYALETKAVLVDGVASPKGTLLSGGEVVRAVGIPEADDWLPLPGEIPGAALLYSDGHLVVLDKPPHVHTEPHSPREAGTLAGYLLYLFPQLPAVAPSPGLTLATRLDYVTSGAVAAAVTAEGASHLAHEREQGRIVKEYACVVEGTIGTEETFRGTIDAEGGERVRVRTGCPEKDPRRWTRVVPLRPAGEGRTLVMAVIRKGKRHQIRAHLAAAGYPIVGDRSYGTVPPDGPGSRRLLLHAAAVSFRTVEGGEARVVSPLPPEFL